MINLDNLNLKKLQKLKENPLRKEVIIPLLSDLGALNIRDLHGTNEFGIDVYYEVPDIFGEKRRFGIQITAIDLKCGKKPNKNILEILAQIKMAFNRPIPIFPEKIEVTIDGFYVITSKDIYENAGKFIVATRTQYPYLHLIDGKQLIQIIQKRKYLKETNASNLATKPIGEYLKE